MAVTVYCRDLTVTLAHQGIEGVRRALHGIPAGDLESWGHLGDRRTGPRPQPVRLATS